MPLSDMSQEKVDRAVSAYQYASSLRERIEDQERTVARLVSVLSATEAAEYARRTA